MKKVLKHIGFSLFAAALLVLTGYLFLERSRQQVTEIEVHIFRQGEKGFLNSDTLRARLNPGRLTQLPVRKLNTDSLENLLAANPYVAGVDIFVSIDNRLVVNVAEKQPLLRIFNREADGYYIDKEGAILPLSTTFTPRVLIANGYLNVPFRKGHNHITDSLYRDSVLGELFELAQLIHQDAFLNAQINQIYVNSKSEYDLVPVLGNQIIHLGSMDFAREKLKKLEIFYREAMAKAGWEKYKTINLEFANQVVCTKRKNSN